MAGASQVRAGAAFVELFVDDNRLTRGLKKAERYVMDFGRFVQGIGIKMGAAGGAILGPLIGALTSAAERGKDVKKIADNIGATVEQVSALQHGFGAMGVSADTFGSAMEALATNIAQAADANDYLMKDLMSLGTGRDFEALSLPEQFNAIVAAIQRANGPTRQLEIATRLFGAAGRDMLPILRQMGTSFASVAKEAEKAGAVLTPEQAEQSTALLKAVSDVWGDLKTTIQAVGLALLPTATELTQLATYFRDALRDVREFVAANKATVVGLAAVGAGLVAAGLPRVHSAVRSASNSTTGTRSASNSLTLSKEYSPRPKRFTRI